MHKILKILTFIFLLFFTSTIFGAEEINKCEVVYGPSPELTQYLRDLRFMLSKIRNIGSQNNCNASILPNKIASKSEVIVKDINSLLNFSGFMSSWEFNMYPILLGAMPDAFYRDHDYIDNQTIAINNLTTNVAKNCNMDKIISDSAFLSKIKYYGFNKENMTLGESTSFLRKLNTSIVVYFRCLTAGSITSASCELDGNKIIEGITKLQNDIEKNYGKESKQLCISVQKKDELSLSLIGKILTSPFGFSSYDKTFRAWREALTLLSGVINLDTNEKQERSILRKELRRQGLSSSQADSVVKQLDCFNQGKAMCYLEHLIGISQAINSFLKALDTIVLKDTPSTSDIPRRRDNVIMYDNISREIKEEYSFQVSVIKQEDKTLERGIANLIILHKNLIDINKKMIDTFDDSRKACNSQARGIGNCN